MKRPTAGNAGTVHAVRPGEMARPPLSVTTQSIRDHDSYAGVRVSMDCLVATATAKLKLDINFGDPVTPWAARG